MQTKNIDFIWSCHLVCWSADFQVFFHHPNTPVKIKAINIKNIKFSKCSIMFSMSMTKKLWYNYRHHNKVKDRWFRGSSSPTMVCMKTKYLASLHVFWGGVCLKWSSLTLSKSYVCHSGLQTSKIAWPIY